MTRNTRTSISLLIILALSVIILGACGNRPADNNAGTGTANSNAKETAGSQTPKGCTQTSEPAETNTEQTEDSNPIVTIQMEDEQLIRIELYPDIAPNTVNNFISLVQDCAYDDTIFHRVIKGFMIQGGDPEGSGLGGPGYSIAGEFTNNGFPNDLSHTRGVISMARSEGMDTAGSQFFIVETDSPHLDGNYAAFGEVIEGMEVIDEITQLPVGTQARPHTPPVMEKVTVELFGKTYPEPELIEDELAS
ncbi:peptidylprolyl isomerase [Paenibacillus sp. 1P07SE]|uniref:peptidylprolyl isomerase n=1 Tax=Paenibacillus sp. 1P07SE TaxID=3132209 RepID=UPI0039A65054